MPGSLQAVDGMGFHKPKRHCGINVAAGLKNDLSLTGWVMIKSTSRLVAGITETEETKARFNMATLECTAAVRSPH